MAHYPRIKQMREERKLTQRDVFESLGMQKTSYTNYEQGKREIPFEVVIKIAKLLGVSTDYLGGLTDEK